MKLLDFTISLKRSTDPITLIPFGCVHRDDPGFREPLFRQCIEEIRDTPNCYGIGMGDYANFLRTTARKHLKSYVADDNSFQELDGMVKSEAITFYKRYLEVLAKAGKLIGLAEGNHYHEFQNSTTDTQFLCDLAKVPYLDKPAFIRLNVQAEFPSGPRTLKSFRLLAHHGDWNAGNSRVGGDVASIETKSLGFGDFDIFLAGHTHRLWGMHIPTLTIPLTGALKVIERPRAFIRTGCFMSGYDPKCQKSYAHKKLLPPTELGYCRLTIQFYREYDPERAERRQSRGGAASNFKYKFTVRY